jgi:hypothetical protein
MTPEEGVQMEKKPWTPGPWEATRCETDDGVGWNVTGPSEQWMERGGSSAPYYTEADARLIAEAPRMAEFLADLLAWDDKTDQYDGVGLLPDDADYIRSLLSRIEVTNDR